TLTLASPVPAGESAVKLTYAASTTTGVSGNRLVSSRGVDVKTFDHLHAPVFREPRNLRTTVVGRTRIDLAWDAPGGVGRHVTGYKVEASPDPPDDSTWRTLVANQTARTYSHLGLDADSTWHYRVSAINGVMTGPVSGVVSETTNVLVSNTNQPSDPLPVPRSPFLLKPMEFKAIQLFTTGSETHGYRLSSIEVTSAEWEPGAPYTVEIWGTTTDHWTEACGVRVVCRPVPDEDTVIARLSAPTGADPSRPGQAVFRAPQNTTLERDTTYALVYVHKNTFKRYNGIRLSTNVDAGAASGWSIADYRYHIAPMPTVPGFENLWWVDTETWTIRIRGTVNSIQDSEANTEATGLPGISGTARVGEELTAKTNTIEDEDGLEDATFTYEWLADGEAIGASGRTYTVGDGYVGVVLSVRVTFTDDAGNEETLTSEPTAEVVANSLALESATVDGATLTLTFPEALNMLVDLPETAFTVMVEGTARTVSGSTVSGSTVTLTLASAVDAGETVTVGYEKPEGNSVIGSLRGVAAESFSGREVTNETAGPGLTASASSVPDSHDGSAAFSFELRFSEAIKLSYVTVRDHAFTVSGGRILNASRLTRGSNLGWRITVEPSGSGSVTLTLLATTDCAARGAICTSDGTKLSAALSVVVAGPGAQQQSQQNSTATGSPSISGTARVGEELTASTSDIADADGLTNVSYTYLWLADGTEISGATSSTYTLAATDEGKAVTVRVSFTDDAGNAESLTSAATSTVARRNSAATGSPSISGTARVGEELTASTSDIADADGLTNVSYTYLWLADGTEISGATSSTYTLAATDEGKAVTVRVSFTDDAGNAESLTSAATSTVAPPPLTASVREAPGSHDGSAAFIFELHFSETLDLSYVTLRDHAFTVSGGSVLNARRLTRGSNLGWEITVQPSSTDGVTIVLPVTTDCEAEGALCTPGGKKLSEKLELTVAGP
ncbi:MAG: hypothetical protein F4Z96_01725, partial [Chloroflexi bacterium]|nr:hypothetical protein [Chloroflexota bacterium]